MVDKKEYAIIFRKEKRTPSVIEFIPMYVVEGSYLETSKVFMDYKNNSKYEHIDLLNPEAATGFAVRTSIELLTGSLTEEAINNMKNELLNYANKYTFIKDYSKNACIVLTEKETGNEYLFEDVDILREKNIKRQQEYTKELEPVEDEDDELDEDNEVVIDLTPKEIETEVKKTIKGQDEAIRKISTCIWTTFNYRSITKKQMLLIGPTGVGKTAIFRKLQKVLDIPVIIFSVPGLSQAGYTGRSTDEILRQIYYECDEDEEKMKNCIVILDEIDKLAFKDISSGEISTSGVQNELLKIVEGCKRFVDIEDGCDTFGIDTTNILFVASGAFQELFEKEKTPVGFVNDNNNKKDNQITTDKLVKYGLKRELIGRFPIKVTLNSLTKEIFREIILESDESEFMSHVNFLKSCGITISNMDEIIDIIIEDAISKEIGARGLVETISNMLLEIIYEVSNNPGKYNEVTIGKNILKDPKDFELTEARNKKRVRTKKG